MLFKRGIWVRGRRLWPGWGCPRQGSSLKKLVSRKKKRMFAQPKLEAAWRKKENLAADETARPSWCSSVIHACKWGCRVLLSEPMSQHHHAMSAIQLPQPPKRVAFYMAENRKCHPSVPLLNN